MVDILEKQADRIAKRLEAEKGIPYKVTYDRVRGVEGWRERELDYLADKTKTPQTDVAKVIYESAEGETKEEQKAAGLAAARSMLINREKLQTLTAKEKAGEPLTKAEQFQKTLTSGRVNTQATRTVATVDADGKTVNLNRSQYQNLTGEDANTAFKTSINLGLIPTGSVMVPGSNGEWSYITQAQASDIKAIDKGLYNTLTTKGYDAYQSELEAKNEAIERKNKAAQLAWRRKMDEIDKITEAEADKMRAYVKESLIAFASSGGPPEKAGVRTIVKQIYRSLTPWQEDAGETFLDYLKNTPQRLMKNELSQPSQAELKAQYEAEKSAPLWSKILSGGESSVIYDKKSDTYIPVLTGEAPMIGPAKTAKAASTVVKEAAKIITKTITPKDVGMSEKVFAAFMKARAANPKLTPEAYRLNEVLKTIKPKLDWGAVTRSISLKVQKAKPKNKSELVSWIEKEIVKQAPKTELVIGKKTPTEIKKLAQEYVKLSEKIAKEGEANLAKSIKVINKKGASLTPQQKKIADAFRQAREARATTQSPKTILASLPEPAQFIKTANLNQLSQSQQEQVLTVLSPGLQQSIAGQPFNKLSNQLQNQIKQEVMASEITATILANAIATANQTRTETETEQQTNTKLQNLVNEQVKQIQDPQLRNQVEQDLKQISTPKTILNTPTRITTPTLPEAPPKTPKAPPKTPSPRPPLWPGNDDKEARERIKNADGAITWRMGEVGKLDRWDVIVNPYKSKQDYEMVFGKPPQGATMVKKGEGSAYGTAQVMKGKSPKETVEVDSGIMDIEVTPTGKRAIKLRMTPDPKGETTGDISIGERKNIRITPKMPRISPKKTKINRRG